MARRLQKFKCDKDRFEILVKYDVEVKGGSRDVVTLESNEKPSRALLDAFAVMSTHLIAIAELPPEWKDELTIIGVTRSILDDGSGIVITGLRKLKHQDAPLVLNSPHTTSFSMECTLDLAKLEDLVLRYADGMEREQRVLKFEREPAGVTG